MKTNKILLIVATFIISIAIYSCTKDPGAGGVATIKGVVTNQDGAVEGAMVYITYGTTEKTGENDNVTVSLEDGGYLFEGLTKGDYYVEASYVDNQGYSFISTGYSVTVGSKKSEVVVNIELE